MSWRSGLGDACISLARAGVARPQDSRAREVWAAWRALAIEVAHISPIGLGRLHAARRVFQRRGARPEPGAQWLAASATPAITLRQLGNQDKLGFFAPSWGAAACASSPVRSKHVRM